MSQTKRKRRTKAAYAELHDNPMGLFEGMEVTLYPNGVPEIWVKNPRSNQGFKIRGSNGPAGFGLTIEPLYGAPPTDLLAYDGDEKNDSRAQIKGLLAHINIVQYHADEWSQLFRKWVRKEGEHPGDVPSERGVRHEYAVARPAEIDAARNGVA